MIRIEPKFTGNAFNGRMLSIVNQEFGKAMTESILTMETEVASNTPVNFGTLRQGIHGRVVNPYFGEVGVTGPASIYAPVVELGRRPGKFPPPDAIMLWVKRKLGIREERELKQVAYLVGRKIARKGFAGAFMFRNAERKLRRRVLNRFVRAGQNIERRLSS